MHDFHIRWLAGKGIPQHDTSQDITNASVNRSNGSTTMIFTRSRITGDTDHDIKLHCQSIFFAWGKKVTSKNSIIKVHKPRFEKVSENDTCFCPTVGVTPMPSSEFTPTIATPDLCQSCSTVLNKCRMNATCKTILEDEQHCKNIFEWDEFSNDTAPVCTKKCKENLVATKKILGNKISCCNCGEITDDHELSDITAAISCRQLHKNIDRWCPNTVVTSCPECDQGCVANLVTTSCKRCLLILCRIILHPTS